MSEDDDMPDEIEEDLDDEELDLDDDLELDDELDLGEDDLVEGESEVDVEEDEDEETEAPAKRKTSAGDDDEDDEEVDPDDVEADLDEILRDRIAAGDDDDDEDDEEEEEQAAPRAPAGEVSDVAPKRDDEWLCEGCFLIVSRRQFGRPSSPQCPSGEDPCPSLARLG